MKDFEKVLVLLYEAQKENDRAYPQEVIRDYFNEAEEECILEILWNKQYTNMVANRGIGDGLWINMGNYPYLTSLGVGKAEELLKPWWQKIKVRFTISCALAMLFLTVFINLDKIEANYHKYISNGKLVSFIATHIKTK